MNHLKMTSAVAVTLLLLALQSVGLANVVGYNTTTVPAHSDVYVSVPFTLTATATYTVSSVAGGVGVNVAGPLTVNQYQNLYYVRFTSGSASGQWSTISSNSATQIAFSVTSFLGSVSAGDTFQVYRHQTLDSVFPDGYAGLSYQASTSITTRLTEILIPGGAVGINKSASDTYYYRNSDWRRVGSDPTASFNDVVLAPQTYFILRNNTANPLTFAAAGNVTSSVVVDRVNVETAKNDSAKTAGNPVSRTLGSLNLGGTPAFVNSTLATGNGDQLFLYNNATAGINKSAAKTYYFRVVSGVGALRLVGDDPTVSHDNDVIPAGAALQIRKVAAGSSTTVAWPQNLPY